MGFEFKNPFAKKEKRDWSYLDNINKEMVKNGDRQEVYKNEKLKGIEAAFINMAREITVLLNKENPSSESEVSSSQYHKNFTKENLEEAKTFFAELKNRIDAAAEKGEDKEAVFSQAESLFS